MMFFPVFTIIRQKAIGSRLLLIVLDTVALTLNMAAATVAVATVCLAHFATQVQIGLISDQLLRDSGENMARKNGASSRRSRRIHNSQRELFLRGGEESMSRW